MGIAELWWESDLAVLDVETTGLDSKVERVIEVAVIHMRAGAVLESWGTLINPEDRPVPVEVQKLTGITPEQLVDQPTFKAIAAELRARLEGKVFVAYNLSFDKGFITHELSRAGLALPIGPELDPLVFARELLKDLPSKRLGNVAAHLGITLTEAHRATDDATVAGHVLSALRAQLPPRLEDLMRLGALWSEQQEAAFAARRRRRGEGSAPEETPMAPKAPAAARGGRITLGPAYIYGDEPDPLRYFYRGLPDVGGGARKG